MMQPPIKSRTMYPRPQKGEMILAALRLSVTDEQVTIARLAWKDPATAGQLWVQYGTRALWHPDYPSAEYGHHIAGAVMDVVEWTVS